MVEHQLPKLRVVGSSPIVRSRMVARKPAPQAGFRVSGPAFALSAPTRSDLLELGGDWGATGAYRSSSYDKAMEHRTGRDHLAFFSRPGHLNTPAPFGDDIPGLGIRPVHPRRSEAELVRVFSALQSSLFS